MFLRSWTPLAGALNAVGGVYTKGTGQQLCGAHFWCVLEVVTPCRRNPHRYARFAARPLEHNFLSRICQSPSRSRLFSEPLILSLLHHFRAEELEVLVTGTSELDFEELAKATEYEGGYGADHRTILAFWRAVGRMPAEEQRRLLMFVTGSKKVSFCCVDSVTCCAEGQVLLYRIRHVLCSSTSTDLSSRVWRWEGRQTVI